MGVTNRFTLFVLASVACLPAQRPELRFCLRADPVTFDPLLAQEEASETLRYLTGGVLIRLNRRTQKLEPELATSWTIRDQGRRIDFVLRRSVRFSDGVPFGPDDVLATVRRLMSSDLHSAIADTFRSAGGEIKAEKTAPDRVSISFSAPVAGLELLFDQLAMISARAVRPENAVLGPFLVQQYKGGQYVLLQRNPHYWKTDASGTRLPYLKSIRVDIQANRETEMLRFRRGQLDFIDRLEPEAFDRLQKDLPACALNAGPSLDYEFFWFNQSPAAPMPAPMKRWFHSRLFRRAISYAVNRDDIIRLVYRGHAHVSVGPVSRANTFWFNSKLEPDGWNPQLALKLLYQDGFRLDDHTLRDRNGNAVAFSLITNAGSRTRTQIGTMLQQDFRKIGIQLNFTPIEFQSLIERITRTQEYETCLLGIVNVGIDPNEQMNVWMSSGTHHAWSPGQVAPATAWEAEIDRLMQLQHTAMDLNTRKRAFDRVQEIVLEQAPIVYLVHPSVLVAVSPLVRNAAPSALPPHLLWNIADLAVAPAERRKD